MHLKYRPSIGSKPATGRRHDEAEIEITPEMIRAGLAAYRGRDSRFMLDEDIIVEISLRWWRRAT